MHAPSWLHYIKLILLYIASWLRDSYHDDGIRFVVIQFMYQCSGD